MGVFTFLFQTASVQALVYTTYAGLVAPAVERFEVAWLLATIDRLLDLSVTYSLLLWIGFPAIAALSVRQPAGVFKALAAGVLLPAGTWLLFAYKYLAVSGLSAVFLPFLLWRLVATLCFAWVIAGVLVLPFWLRGRKASESTKAPTAIRFVCQQCGAEYGSNPAVCVRCGAEGKVREVAQI
jgi:hypothetical protein